MQKEMRRTALATNSDTLTSATLIGMIDHFDRLNGIRPELIKLTPPAFDSLKSDVLAMGWLRYDNKKLPYSFAGIPLEIARD